MIHSSSVIATGDSGWTSSLDLVISSLVRFDLVISVRLLRLSMNEMKSVFGSLLLMSRVVHMFHLHDTGTDRVDGVGRDGDGLLEATVVVALASKTRPTPSTRPDSTCQDLGYRHITTEDGEWRVNSIVFYLSSNQSLEVPLSLLNLR